MKGAFLKIVSVLVLKENNAKYKTNNVARYSSSLCFMASKCGLVKLIIVGDNRIWLT